MSDPINAPGGSNQHGEMENSSGFIERFAPTSQEKYEDRNFVDTTLPVWNYSILYDDDISNYQNGTHYNLYKKFGSKRLVVLGKEGYYFCVWAPNATKVTVVGNFNDWDKHSHVLHPRWDKSGIWEGFIPGIPKGELYKYNIRGYEGKETEKGDPFANFWEKRPLTSSITWEFDYKWNDEQWMKERKKHNSLEAPWSVYEVHLASWMRPDRYNEESYNTYSQLADLMVPYVKEMGFTHVELMPVMEHPFDGSWGYQCTGFFAPTSRFGAPEDFMYLIDRFHQEGIGVILDWVPSHFPYDAHGLFMFDGTHTYEYADMRKGFHPDWNSYIFNYKRGEVKSFLISSARFWFDLFHIDGIRVDAVSSMLKLDYSRNEGEWEPNEYGGNGNLEAIAFIKDLNETLFRDFHDIQTIAEEATDWPGISKPTFGGGLGFGMKWMMGWMHDTLDYFKLDPLYRKDHQNKLTFSMMYYYDENFMLPISHDEVVHGKSPMIYKMPGDEWQKFANLRTMYTYMWTHPGARLLFMGSEFGQTSEWNYKSELDWYLLAHPFHKKLQDCVKDLNHLLTSEEALYVNQFNTQGFEWVDLNHRDESVVVYRRKGKQDGDDLLVILNLTPMVRMDWVIDVRHIYNAEIFNSDAEKYGGSGNIYNPDIRTETLDREEDRYRLTINLPPLAGIILK
ncbi:1,4-alpha-glucan branching protein GlgB [Flavisolibacter ginsengisoli]|jgi:1,4-alpha-glucan branching enzyme|uniref:1,4-alpha-glucan branching enzyme GlgB n=1 Tax=Flavisolibacter ginsengisoli DSM 18119 TaxID=1121884 RepID=A0A1M4X8T4_9BACT|nr:1,4-alpha-glucan branching protein GlgB [Flavisolibacter ginsengisoli]SHE89918.1 1,4-alpha-glucan branching enzyme [Flavisolibacter ginsengisoli DSM 18119]